MDRPVMRYHGGKWRIAPWIIGMMPGHTTYVEPFCGAASVLMRKEMSPVEVINDQFSRVTGCMKAIRDFPDAVARSIYLTPFSFDEYMIAREESDDPIEDARRMIILGHQGHGSTAASGGKLSGWRRYADRDGKRNTAKEWAGIHEKIAHWSDRLQGVFIENDSAIDVIRRWDSPGTLMYVDPPYLLSTRTAQGGYAHEMTDLEHEVLAAALHDCKSMVMVSGYGSSLYADLFSGWRCETKSALADKAQPRTECLWVNW